MPRKGFYLIVFIYLITQPVNAEVRVNPHPGYEQTYPAICQKADGDFIIVWSSYHQDGASGGIYARNADSVLNFQDDSFIINTTTAGHQTNPAIAACGSGFIVVWQSETADLEDIIGRRFDHLNQPFGDDFVINTTTAGRQLYPKICCFDDGRFAVVWESRPHWPGMDYSEIVIQLFDINGIPESNEINSNLLSQSRYPDIATDGNHQFVVVWMQDDAYHPSNRIMARRFDLAGNPLDSPFQVNEVPFYTASRPTVSMASNGNFIVVWSTDPNDADRADIRLRRFNHAGDAATNELVVNRQTEGKQENPEVKMNIFGQYIVFWNGPGPDDEKKNVYAQRFNAANQRVGDEFVVHRYRVQDQKYSHGVFDDDGHFTVAWQSYGQDGYRYGIFAETGPKAAVADLDYNLQVEFGDFCILAREWLDQGDDLIADIWDDDIVDAKDAAALCDQWLMMTYSQPQADLWDDGVINMNDFAILANTWQQQGPFTGDITSDGRTNTQDLRIIMYYWLQ